MSLNAIVEDRRAFERVFHRSEEGQAGIAQTIYSQISNYYSRYDPVVYGSPYTSIVGPSGIGKSFTLQSIARQGLAYVVYVSLAEPESAAYPPRSYVASDLTSSLQVYLPEDRGYISNALLLPVRPRFASAENIVSTPWTSSTCKSATDMYNIRDK
jgi:hypothetical protein